MFHNAGDTDVLYHAKHGHPSLNMLGRARGVASLHAFHLNENLYYDNVVGTHLFPVVQSGISDKRPSTNVMSFRRLHPDSTSVIYFSANIYLMLLKLNFSVTLIRWVRKGGKLDRPYLCFIILN